MDRKLNVALVLGSDSSRRLLDAFSSLTDSLDVKALGLLSDIGSESYMTEIPLQTFIEDQHLPGYLLGAEEELAKADIIVASGFNDAATYQSFRYAYHHRKSFLLFCPKEADLKQGLLLRADEFQDCLANASGFLVYEDAVAETLEFMGVASDKIHRLKPEIDVRKFGFHEKLRTKFRDYLKVSRDEKLVVSQLSEDQAPYEIMAGLKALESLDPELFAKTKLLFVGQCSNKDALKYRAVDLNLTKSILFIAQDVKPFFADLMASTDLFLSLGRDLDHTERLFSALEGMASGVKVLVASDHPLVTFVEPTSIVENPAEIAKAMAEALQAPLDRAATIRIVSDHFGKKDGSIVVLDFLRSRMADLPSLLPLAGDFNLVLHELELQARHGMEAFSESFEIEMGRWGSHGDYKGKLLVLKGQKLLSSGQLDEALAAFELCTSEISVQREAFLGLAKIAFLTHSYEESMSFYRKALALKPNDPEAMGGIGNIYRKLGMAHEAVYWLGKAISVDIEHTRYLSSLTQACLESEDHERSISLLEQLKVLLGNKPALIMCLGQLYFSAGDPSKGKELVDLALEITAHGKVPSLTA